MSESSTPPSIPSRPIDDAAVCSHVNLLLLVGRDTRLERVAPGEFAGACPFCGGRDRFHVRPFDPDGGRWHCRHCTVAPDGSPLWLDAVEYAARRQDVCHLGACRYLLGPLGLPIRAPRPPDVVAAPAASPAPPPAAWQQAATEALARCAERLEVAAIWLQQEQLADATPEELPDEAPEAAHAYLWLRQQGLRPATIRAAGLGFNPAWEEVQPGRWLAPGITIPAREQDTLWYVRVRVNPRYPGDPTRYRELPGGRAGWLFNGGLLQRHIYGLLVEEELDALLLQQEARGLVAVAALSASTLPRRWRRQFGHLRHLFIHMPGARLPRERWVSALRGGPAEGESLAQFVTRGGSVRAWIRDGLATTADAVALNRLAGELLRALPDPPAQAIAAYRELAEIAGPFHAPATPPERYTVVRVAEDWSQWALYDEGRFVRHLDAAQARAVSLGHADPVLLAVGEIVGR